MRMLTALASTPASIDVNQALVYHCENGRRSEICCARDIAEKSLNRMLLLLEKFALKKSRTTFLR